MPTSYLVSGANRGLGLAIVTALVKRDDTIVFAGSRDINAQTLVDLSKEHPGKLEIVRLDSADEESGKSAAATIESKVGKLDVVYANAGISRYVPKAVDTPLEEFKDHINVNVLGPLILFKSTYKLLEKSSLSHGKFIVIASIAGSIADLSQMATAPYGLSKAGVNYLVRKLQFEHQNLIVAGICPGLVYTDLVKTFGEKMGQDFSSFCTTPEESAQLLIQHADSLTAPEAESTTFRSLSDGGRDVPY